MQERQKWNNIQRNLTMGDIVLIADATAPRNSWLIGRVIKTLPDKSGIVRTVQIQTKTNIIERPETKLRMVYYRSINDLFVVIVVFLYGHKQLGAGCVGAIAISNH